MDVTPIPHPPYEWDENKREDTLTLRGLDFALVTQIDWGIATYRRDERQGEVRYASLALIADRLHHIVWTPRGNSTRIISLRKANARERVQYDRQQT